jgi:hypothetical protein
MKNITDFAKDSYIWVTASVQGYIVEKHSNESKCASCVQGYVRIFVS